IRNARVAGDLRAAEEYCNVALQMLARVQSSKDIGYSPGLKIGITVELLNLELARKQPDVFCAAARTVLPPAMLPIIAMDGFVSYVGEHAVAEPDSWVSSLAFSPGHACVETDAFNLTASTRGRNMDTVYALGKAASSDRDSELAKRLAILRSYEKLLPPKVLDIRGAGNEGPAASSLRNDIEGLQNDLIFLAGVHVITSYFDASAVVARSLPETGAFILLTAFQALPNIGSAGPHRDVGAYVLKRSGELRLIRLGSYSAVSHLTTSVRRDCAPDDDSHQGSLRACRSALRALGQVLIDPLSSEIRGTSRLFIMPSQEFAFIPFSALIDEKGHYLIEKTTVTMLYSARRRQKNQTAQRDNRITIFADPAYNTERASSQDALRRNIRIR